jgi:hypothetical protein
MDVAEERWLLRPNLKLALAPGYRSPAIDLDQLALDLGFAQVQGIPAATAQELAHGRPALGLRFGVDLQKLAAFGGPVPPQLGEQPGRLAGTIAIVVPEELEHARLAEMAADLLHVDANVNVPQLAVTGATMVEDLAVRIAIDDGKASIAAGQGAKLNGGALTLQMSTDLRDADLATSLALGVDGAYLGRDAGWLLQYAVPLLAGVGGQRQAAIEGKASTRIELRLPAAKGEATLLQWLDRWSGSGSLSVGAGSIAPAAAFAPLLQLAGAEGGKLSFDGLTTEFKLASGAVETTLLKLSRKASKLGITGRTMLSGEIDHRIDLRGLLAEHKDGRRVLEIIGDAPLAAGLAGTLAAPRLAMPDVDELFAQAVREAAKRELQKGAEDALRKGLEELFKKKQ